MDAPKNGNAEASRPVGIGWAAALALAIAVGVSRVVPHPWNIPPVAGLCLFLGARQRSWFAFALPLALMFVTDLILIIPYGAIGMASLQTITLFVYASVLLDVAIGRLVRNTRSPIWLTLAGCVGVAQFFVITNFGSWLTGGYPRTLEGLVDCYVMALPFLRNSIIAGLGGFWLFLAGHEVYLLLAHRPALALEQASETP